ncbi:hypothetical protein LTR36_004409 [Oleoguttula mirabilis]|uniref:Nonribosomal peptide synthetase 12 n=1 Tax=Oleoguttula mirabilis TaxID=1507867 RepID=A0AAV9JI79_9PEZI|nr:hypothetical protein LTR36_004409 [Oleoguttula mirabilis]
MATAATPASSRLPQIDVTVSEPISENQTMEEDPQRPTLSHTQHTLRTYAFNSPRNTLVEDLQAPARVHLTEDGSGLRGTYPAYRRAGLLTVGPRSDTAQSNTPSFVSSGISVNEISTPDAVRQSALLHPPGTYNIIVRDSYFSKDSTASTDGSLEQKSEAEYVLEPTCTTYADKIATQENLTACADGHPLPAVQGSNFWSQMRYLCLTCYRRQLILILLANVATIAVMTARERRHPGSFTFGDAATATGANLLASILMRQEHVINLIYHAVCALPHSTPLRIRCIAARFAYSTGGTHSGAGMSALLWYIFYTILLVQQFEGNAAECNAISAIAAFAILMFVVIITVSHPSIRRSYHDYWEMSHRYCGWTTVGLVWAQTMIGAVASARRGGHPVGRTLIADPTFWFLIVITCCLVYPWLWLRRLPVDAKQLSTHATELHFHNRKVPTCVGTRLSRSPLVENHGFATIARSDGRKGYSILVSHAGEFTKKLIMEPPKHIWQRGAPTIGVMRVALLFKPIVVVTTGSGIGPCMSFLNVHPSHPMRVIWSARFPEATYQRDMLAKVFRADKEAVVIDTKKTGHPDLIALTYAMVQEIEAEAVMIISNPKATRELVYAMEARNIPAFGPIFDS